MNPDYIKVHSSSGGVTTVPLTIVPLDNCPTGHLSHWTVVPLDIWSLGHLSHWDICPTGQLSHWTTVPLFCPTVFRAVQSGVFLSALFFIGVYFFFGQGRGGEAGDIIFVGPD